MKRCLKKAVAFGLALSMLSGCMVVSAEETKDNGIAVIEEVVYDEAVSFSDGIVLIENGHWADMIKDEETGAEVFYTDLTENSNIVFIDGEGNKKVISNRDENGIKVEGFAYFEELIEYEYQCVYPENGDITAEEKSIIDQDVNALIEILDEVLGKNAGLSSYSFGFINY